MTTSRFREVHESNAAHFGAAALRFEIALLTAVREALGIAVTPAGERGRRSPVYASAGIAYQQLIDAAYDPAAALRVIAATFRKGGSAQGAFQQWFVAVADTLDQPPLRKTPYLAFRESPPALTGRRLNEIRDGLFQLDILKAKGMSFSMLVQTELMHSAKTASPHQQDTHSAILHLVHERLQQIRGPVARA